MASSMGSNNGSSIEKNYLEDTYDSGDTNDDGMVVTSTYKRNDQMPVRNDTHPDRSFFGNNIMYPYLVPPSYADIPGIHLTVDLHIPPKDKPEDQVLEKGEAQVGRTAAVVAAEPRPAIRDVTGEGPCISLVGGLIPSAESTSKEKNQVPEKETRPSKDQP
ncbi:hypothetical protein R3W88_006156 [Solanum pinnatisectum]|uniref:Uncharacterized protein n=1 Tax=Solanum pinnatisectum TaxID=50273 RepID=A0AAV9KFJ5_9SOLN|nr:hypothetical protein R3W88_006156 [Solanum pinnatisectum]